jgi:hypothetical protein
MKRNGARKIRESYSYDLYPVMIYSLTAAQMSE